MKKAFIIATIIAATVSCSKTGEGSSSVLSGTNWETTDGKTRVSFTETIITINDDDYGTSSSAYNVTAEQKDIATYFNISGLERGTETYTTGIAYMGAKSLFLQGSQSTHTLRFYLK